MSPDSGKPSFSQTCSLLTQYLKENGTTLGDLTLNITPTIQPNRVPPQHTAPPTPTMNLFAVNNTEKRPADIPRNTVKPMNLFPHPIEHEDLSNKMVSSRPVQLDGTTGQKQQQLGADEMTIFYGGQVIVFNDFPADKAKEIMMLASIANSPVPSNPHQLVACSAPKLPRNPVGHNCVQRHPESMATDLPMARRYSLHQFMERRKDRIVTRSPYAVPVTTSEAAPSKPSKSRPWLGLAAPPMHYTN